MSDYGVDTVLRIRLERRPGQLARVAATVAELGALIGDVTTIHVGEGATIRDLTVETVDDAQAQRVVEALRRVSGVEVQQVRDRVFDAHRGGKIHSKSRVELRQLGDLRTIYTPGVARVALAIHRDPMRAWELTTLGRSVGIFTNGTRVLGLGNIGVLASLPVMEGKAVLYDQLAGLSATPVLVDTDDVDEFITTVERLAHSFGAIHLEDIRTPDCFRVESELQRRLAKPVLHDDQHGTATAALAAVINACRRTGRALRTSRVGQIGLGAAGNAIAKLLMRYGVGSMMVNDPLPAAESALTALGATATDVPRLMQEAAIVIATTGQAGLICRDAVRRGQVILALTNPRPEIDPAEALDAGAAFAADGRSVNNALAFPGLFRGALEVRSRAITPEMQIAAAEAIADATDEGAIVPSVLDPRVHAAVTSAVADCAKRLGLAGTARP